MKTITTAVVLLLAATTTFATDGEKKKENSKKASTEVAIINNSPEKFKVVYLKEDKGLVTINLLNSDGKKVDSQFIRNKEGFSQPYNFQDLPAGDYTFEVVDTEGNSTTHPIVLDKPSKKLSFAGNVLNVNDDKKFRLAVLNKTDMDIPLNVKIYGEQNILIHEETVNNLKGFRKIYDLTEVNSDTFQFVISNGMGTMYLSAE